MLKSLGKEYRATIEKEIEEKMFVEKHGHKDAMTEPQGVGCGFCYIQ